MKASIRVAAALATVFLVAGCAAPTSSSTPNEGTAHAAWAGKVFVTEAALPEGVKGTVIGTVRADMRAGYSSGTELYPLLADEARKLGANAVVEVAGGRRVTILSWAAAYVTGTAIKLDDPSALNKLEGSSH